MNEEFTYIDFLDWVDSLAELYKITRMEVFYYHSMVSLIDAYECNWMPLRYMRYFENMK